MTVAAIVVGLALLFCGRQLFWLFVGGMGFVAGMSVATDYFQGQSPWTTLAVALLAGVVGALLAVFLQRLAVGIAGFFAGGYAVWNLASRLGGENWAWLGFVVGGVIAALLVVVLFDWALIVLSSLVGGILIAENLPLDPTVALLVFVGLTVVGIVAQAAALQRTPVSAPPPVEGPDVR